jgi:hypothetical protein
MDTKKLLSIENVLILAGVGFIAYWYLRKPKGVININPKMGESIKLNNIKKPNAEPKTIVLDLREKKKSEIFPQSMYKGYDSREIKTFAPARTVINDL